MARREINGMVKPSASYWAALSMVTLTLLGMTLSACGADNKVSATQTLAGVSLTKPGTALKFGETATVASSAAPATASPISITVLRVAAVPAANLVKFGITSLKPAVQPYYVDVTVKNLGTRDIGGSAIPLYLQDARDVLVGYNPVSGIFTPCSSKPLPKPFRQDAVVKTCLIYLLSKTSNAVLVSYRPDQSRGPITWSGEIAGVENGQNKDLRS